MNIVNTSLSGIARQRGCNADILTILTIGTANDFAVYQGLVTLINPDCHSKRMSAAHWVARSGTKLPYRKAIQHFSELKREEYRD